MQRRLNRRSLQMSETFTHGNQLCRADPPDYHGQQSGTTPMCASCILVHKSAAHRLHETLKLPNIIISFESSDGASVQDVHSELKIANY